MRFSIKWLLAATTYAAAACASVMYANPLWQTAIALLLVFEVVASVIGVAVRRGMTRDCLVGSLASGVAAFSILLAPNDAWVRPLSSMVRTTIGGWIERTITAFDDRQVLLRQFVIAQLPEDAVVGSIIEDATIIEANGRELRVEDGSRQPGYFEVSYSVVGGKNSFGQDFRVTRRKFIPNSKFPYDNWTHRAIEIVHCHLIFLCSLLGGLLGLWFWKQEERARATTTEQVP